MTDDELREIEARDEAADQPGGADYFCASDRHALLGEVHRLRDMLGRVRSGRPTSDIGV